jgi:hypothetical protein
MDYLSGGGPARARATTERQRFQNYEVTFTVSNTPSLPASVD